MSKKLYDKNFNILVLGQIISLFGSSIQRFALSLYLLDLTGSASVFATILAISMIPVVLISPIAGIWDIDEGVGYPPRTDNKAHTDGVGAGWTLA